MIDRRVFWFIILLAPVVVWSAIAPHDRFTWWLEVTPVLVGVPVILVLRRRFPFSTLLLVLLWWHSVVLLVGGKYTYAEVPLGEWAKDWFGWTRNHYDKLGHFAQGFVPAILAREILVRTSPLRPFDSVRGTGTRWLSFLVVCVCLAFSAFYELIEWFVAIRTGATADDFLGTQGDPWDTQTDMLMALLGAILALSLLSRLHSRSMEVIAQRGSRSGS